MFTTKKYYGLKREYLAKEFLLQLLSESSVVSGFLENSVVDLHYEDLLVTKCISLADKLISRLSESGSDVGDDKVFDGTPEAILPIFDGEF